ncbi:inactive transglutaminase family protein [Photobacterium sp. BZF1]|uniref:Gonadoliberin III n=1 Tax=Photobacterium rosenbergii TaxID=294936 RepID=A0A2T3NEE1_9GAMM|nr:MULTISPECIES: inactive transglutaminase family protein [Photobacterium]MBC7006406.1 inactive transglutaminase family protein [Photobacterium sp. BZF1]MBY5943678.1 inactive transglutaminase family protein [Photobacterium rosenbergii]PSW12741.1 gonadoliberin III [Photobacterium rosenbergii]
MTSRIPFYFLITLLVIAGAALSMYRHDVYGVPWTPGEERALWELEARIEFDAIGDPVKVSMAAPETQQGFTQIDESTSSPGYGVALIDTNKGRRAEWSIREATGKQILYYKTQMLVDDQASFNMVPPKGDTVAVSLDNPQQTAATALLDQARSLSSDNVTLTRELIKQFNDRNNQNAALLLNSLSREQAIINLLSLEKIHARIVGGLQLEDGRRRQSITPMVEVWNGQVWELFDLQTGQEGKPDNILLWNQQGHSLLDVIGGRNSNISFSIIAQDITPQQATREKVQAEDLLNFSIHSLPVEEQAMFKTIMLVPIGALIVVFLRIIVGLKTSGTFMPVLIAVAFVQTQLVTGILGFLLIVGTGLVIRSYLSKLNLLLVARISAVIITVIMIISVFTVVAFKIGLVEGLTITFFPMIILSWTIERMSILWEEEGAKEVLIQGGGSLLTAVFVYLAMTNPLIRHLTFNFIGIQLIILALILMLGNYTGYRLSELRRFKPLAED